MFLGSHVCIMLALYRDGTLTPIIDEVVLYGKLKKWLRVLTYSYSQYLQRTRHRMSHKHQRVTSVLQEGTMHHFHTPSLQLLPTLFIKLRVTE